jgi:hypothetical protein
MVVALGSSACSPSLRSGSAAVARGAVPAAVDTTLDKLQEPHAREQLAEIFGSPEMKRAMIDLSEGITEGVGEGLGSDAMSASMTRLMRQLARSFVLAIAESMPALSAAVQKAIAEDWGPAVTTLVRKDLAPSLAELLDAPEMQAAVGKTTREVARQAVLGSNEALAELGEKQKSHGGGGGQPVGTIAALFPGRSWVLVGAGAMLFLVVPMLWMLWQLTTVRGYLQQVSGKTPRELRRELGARRRERHA